MIQQLFHSTKHARGNKLNICIEHMLDIAIRRQKNGGI